MESVPLIPPEIMPDCLFIIPLTRGLKLSKLSFGANSPDKQSRLFLHKQMC